MDMTIKEKIGQVIGTLLAEQNKKQKDLAKELGVTDNTISYFVIIRFRTIVNINT